MPIPESKKTVVPKRVLLRDVVRETIRNAIMDGTLKPGETLNDDALQEWLGTSRTPIRDALNELSRSGLIEMEPNRFTRVAMLPSDSEAYEALTVLGVIYGGAAVIAAPQLSAPEARSLISKVKSAAKGVKTLNADLIRENMLAVYKELVEYSDNSLLQNLALETIDGLAYKIRVARLVEILDADSIARLLDELIEAFESRDGLRARRATDAIFRLPSAHLSEGALGV